MPGVHDLGTVDLNLVRVLGALLDERHLTRAGKRLGLTQSATSHALGRLRRLFDDPLFVRTARGLEPTARAHALSEPVHASLDALQRCFTADAAFDPATSTKSFSVASSDYGSFVLTPKLFAALGREAPNVDLWVRAVEPALDEQLARGDVDAVVMPRQRAELPAAIHARTLYRERFVCLLRKDHPRTKLDLATWTSTPHVFIAPRGRPGGAVDDALAELGKRRRVAVAVPHFLLAPHLVATSNMILTINERVARAFTNILPVRIVEPPMKLPTFDVRMYWHERTHRDPAQRWFRDQIRAATER